MCAVKKGAEAPRDTGRGEQLDAWLRKHDAMCMWQKKLRHGTVECWLFPRSQMMAVVVRFNHGHGWELYTPGSTAKIDETLTDAEKRLGLVAAPDERSASAPPPGAPGHQCAGPGCSCWIEGR